jgi:ribonucleoside-diphosphate reductase alpha chain
LHGTGSKNGADEADETIKPSNGSSDGADDKRRTRRLRPGDANYLSELGEKIFLDRYALKDMDKSNLQVGDVVLVCTDTDTGQREIGTIDQIGEAEVVVLLADGERVTRAPEHVDRPLEIHPDDLQARVARGIAAVEAKGRRAEWDEKFRWLLEGWKFVPGGRILTAAGTDQDLTYYNCYVIPSPGDSREGIIHTLSQMTEIMSRGGGVGINLSSLRPRYAYVKGVNGRSSGSVSWGSLYSFVTGLIEQGGSRRGALMLILDVWHPDLAEFITAKREMGRMTNANISVGITDDFMQAVDADAEWPLVFPDTAHEAYDTEWDGDLTAWRAKGYPVVEHKTVRARDLWNTIVESAWSSAEPGLWFIERANKMSNSSYYAPLVCTNPCGEQPLPGWSVCNLGAINLSRFTKDGGVDWESLRRTVRYAVRFLDDVIDATPYFFEENERQQKRERRIGLGTMGLAELMIRCEVRYGSPEGNQFIDRLYEFIATEAYLASADYAAEKGSFPMFEAEPFLESGFMKGMPNEVREAVAAKGIRNVTLLTQAPTGTTGTMVGTSTGIEPYYSWSYVRQSRLGSHIETAGVFEEWLRQNPDSDPDEDLPDYFVTAMELTPEEHVGVQAAIQRWVDSSISKTCNVPNDYTVEQTRELYEYMYRLGCKGGTVYRDGSRDEQVLRSLDEDDSEKAETRSGLRSAGQPAEVQPRPNRMIGTTYRVATPLGKAYVTVNRNSHNEPFEVFVNLGKAGTDLSADAEALGRLISLIQRLPSPIPPMDRLQRVAEELEGIGGSRTIGFGAEQVRSLPDGIARALRLDLDEEPQEIAPLQAELFPGADLCPSCGHASFVRIEGCRKCFSCGYSEC